MLKGRMLKMARLGMAATTWVLLASQAGAATVCNGFVELCDRPYNEVAYAETHNSFATIEDDYITFNANQSFMVTRQLEDGIRALSLDIYLWNGVVTLCHGGVDLCPLANKPLAEELENVKAFLDANPEEVVTIHFQDAVSASDKAEVFEEVGLYDPSASGTDYLYAHGGGVWPTLGEMIDSGERLVVFAGSTSGYDWLHETWDWMFRTDYRAASLDEFSCDLDRGNPSNDLFRLPHFVTTSLGASRLLAAQANAESLFQGHVDECSAIYGRTPNFLRVDYYEVGDLFAVLETVNGTESVCIDTDGDGYGSPPSPQCTFAQPDCDDTNPNVNPGATEIPGNSIDDDCDAQLDECFIATASYGTSSNDRIEVLRTFRDVYLSTNAPGRFFVHTYYKHSPPLADYIAERGWLRGLVRILLLPVVGFVSLLV